MKKLIALLMALLLTGIIPICTGASAEDTVTVYARVPQNWSEPRLWAWSGGRNAFEAWPGEPMHECGDGWYACSVGGWVDSVIINGNGGSIQTADLSVEAGHDVYVNVGSIADVTVTYEKPDIADDKAPQAASFEQPFSSEDQVSAYLRYCLDNSLTEFQFTCDQALYDRLSADSFDGLNRLKLKSGITDASIRYNSGSYLFDFSEVRYELLPWAECADEASIERAIADMSAQQAKGFILFVGEELCSSLYVSDMINTFGARHGMADLNANYYFSGGIIRVSGVQYAEHFATASDEDSFITAIEFMAHEGAESFFVALDLDFFDRVMSDLAILDRMIAASPMDSYSCMRDYGRHCLDFSEVVYSDVPRIICDTEDEIVQAIRNMGAAGSTAFNLILNDALYEKVYDGYFGRLQQLEAEAGMTSCSMSYNFSAHVLYFTEAVIRTDVEKLSTLEAVNAYTAQQAAANADEITLFCTPEIFDTLMEGFNPYITLSSSGMMPLYDVAAQAGLFNYTFSLSEVTRIIVFKNVVYYPGTNIGRAVQTGDDSTLSDRERETWRAAQALADACRGQTPLDTARSIHDRLAEMIVYTDDETTDEDDTAIGALLNGKANCDGYADAFYIVGTLAGLEVRYQHGDSYNIGFNSDFMNQITHMWNLIRIDGTWRLVDVTWDDDEDRLNHTWFNLGYDRAARMHIWNEAMTVALDPVTDLSVRPANEYLVADAAEAEQAVADAANHAFGSFAVIYTDEAAAGGHFDLLNSISGKASNAFLYSWNERMLMLSVYDIAF